MESDSTGDYEKQKEHRDSLLNDSDISEPIWVCRTIRSGDEVVRGLLDYNIYILCIGIPILLAFFYLA